MTPLSAKLYFKCTEFEAWVESVCALPIPYRPTHFTGGERIVSRSKDLIADSTRFLEFRESHRVGFMLKGPVVAFDFMRNVLRDKNHQPVFSRVAVDFGTRSGDQNENRITAMLRLLCAREIGFAGAYDFAEWEHRNRLYKRFGKFSVEFVIGDDFRKAIPGLYWQTVIPDELCIRHGLNIAEVARIGDAYELWTTGGGQKLHWFRLFPHASDWRNNEERIDKFCSDHPQFFSLLRIAPELEAIRTKDELDIWAAQYR